MLSTQIHKIIGKGKLFFSMQIHKIIRKGKFFFNKSPQNVTFLDVIFSIYNLPFICTTIWWICFSSMLTNLKVCKNSSFFHNLDILGFFFINHFSNNLVINTMVILILLIFWNYIYNLEIETNPNMFFTLPTFQLALVYLIQTLRTQLLAFEK